MKISIVVPLYNEERTIINILSKIQNEIKKLNEFNFEVIIINDGSNDIHLIKDVPIAQGGSIELIDGGAKFVVQSGDRLYIKSSVSAGIDAWVSVVDAIST